MDDSDLIEHTVSSEPVYDGKLLHVRRDTVHLPDGHEAVVHLTLTDDHPWAQAFVVIEANPL